LTKNRRDVLTNFPILSKSFFFSFYCFSAIDTLFIYLFQEIDEKDQMSLKFREAAIKLLHTISKQFPKVLLFRHRKNKDDEEVLKVKVFGVDSEYLLIPPLVKVIFFVAFQFPNLCYH
jgi:hypothetical protein